jgi:hypothetical protein
MLLEGAADCWLSFALPGGCCLRTGTVAQPQSLPGQQLGGGGINSTDS